MKSAVKLKRLFLLFLTKIPVMSLGYSVLVQTVQHSTFQQGFGRRISKSVFPVGMSSHFFKFIFKTSQYHQMKALNERISEWPDLAL